MLPMDHDKLITMTIPRPIYIWNGIPMHSNGNYIQTSTGPLHTLTFIYQEQGPLEEESDV